ALQRLGMGGAGVGALTAAVGIGGVVGGAFVFTRLRSGRHGADLALGLLLFGVPLVLLALLSSEAAAFLLLAVAGVGVTVVDVASVTLLQRTAGGDLLPHALGVLQTVFVAGVPTRPPPPPVLVPALARLRGSGRARPAPTPRRRPARPPACALAAAAPARRPTACGARARRAARRDPDLRAALRAPARAARLSARPGRHRARGNRVRPGRP